MMNKQGVVIEVNKCVKKIAKNDQDEGCGIDQSAREILMEGCGTSERIKRDGNRKSRRKVVRGVAKTSAHNSPKKKRGGTRQGDLLSWIERGE